MATTASTTYGTLSYIEEVEPGRIPATGTVRNLRFKKPNFKAATSTKSSEESRLSRMTTGQVLTDLDVTGGVDFELSAREYDPFLQGLLGTSFIHYGESGRGADFPFDRFGMPITETVDGVSKTLGHEIMYINGTLDGTSSLQSLTIGTWFKVNPPASLSEANKKYFRNTWFVANGGGANYIYTKKTHLFNPPDVIPSDTQGFSISSSQISNATATSSYVKVSRPLAGFKTVEADSSNATVDLRHDGKFIVPAAGNSPDTRKDLDLLADVGREVRVFAPSLATAAGILAKKHFKVACPTAGETKANQVKAAASQLVATGVSIGTTNADKTKGAVGKALYDGIYSSELSGIAAPTTAQTSAAATKATGALAAANTEALIFDRIYTFYSYRYFKVKSIQGVDTSTTQAARTIVLDTASVYSVTSDGVIDAADEAAALTGMTFSLGFKVETGALREERSFAFEYALTDIGKYAVYKGNRVDSLDLNIEVGSIVEGSFGFVGMGHDPMSATSAMPPGDMVASFEKLPMNSVTDLGYLRVNGKSVLDGITSFVKSLKLSVKNNLRGRKAVGVFGSTGVGMGALEISGTLEVYLEDEALYNMWLKNQAISLEVGLTDSEGYGYLIELPKIHFTDGQLNNSETHADTMLSLPIKAYEDGNGTGIRIVRCVPA